MQAFFFGNFLRRFSLYKIILDSPLRAVSEKPQKNARKAGPETAPENTQIPENGSKFSLLPFCTTIYPFLI